MIEGDHVSHLVHLVLDSRPAERIRSSSTAVALGLRLFDMPGASAPPGCPAPCFDTNGPFERDLRARLPAKSRVIANRDTNSVWIRYGQDPRWLWVPSAMPPSRTTWNAMALTLALVIMTSLATAWHIQKPVSRLARAAHAFRKSEQSLSLRPHGPSEIKKLIHSFNEMARELSEADEERAIMLAGIAHDLRAPLTRMKLRASFVVDEELRAGLMQDATSLSQIITQFLDFARDTGPDASAPRIAVDTFCRSNYSEADDADACPEAAEYPVCLYLAAGPNFTLPQIELDRMLSNLVENAFTYGAPPLHIETSRNGEHYRLTVRDHGPGMPEADMVRAVRPFVRLNPRRGADAHCGLGLSIVRRLVRRHGGSMSISNASSGGLSIQLTFPSQTSCSP